MDLVLILSFFFPATKWLKKTNFPPKLLRRPINSLDAVMQSLCKVIIQSLGKQWYHCAQIGWACYIGPSVLRYMSDPDRQGVLH
jgi:hypothetical protein